MWMKKDTHLSLSVFEEFLDTDTGIKPAKRFKEKKV